MAQRVEIPIARRQGEAKSKFVSAQQLRNAFLEQDPETGAFAIYSGPGLKLFSSVSAGAVRGLHNFNGVLLAVCGPTLYTLSQGGVATARGTIVGTEPVIIDDNGTQAVIVSDALSYVWDGTSLSTVTDPDFQVASSVTFQDQYMIFTKADSGAFFISALADATSYDALDIASAESRPDNLVRALAQGREVLLFGTKTIEGWYDAGDADFPFIRDQTYVDYGLISKYAVAIIDNSVAWLANDKTVRIIRGGSPQIISDPLISAEIEKWADASETVAFTYTLRGHQFFVLRNPDGCVVWDASLPANLAWTSRSSQDMDTWRIGCSETMEEWGGTIICGDASTGILYVLDPDAYSENGAELIWSLTSRTMGPGGKTFTLHALEVEIEPGVSLTNGQGSDAQVWLDISYDGGFTFGNRMARSLGARGERNKQIVWRRLGQFLPHGGVLRLSGSDPVPNALTRGWADIEADETP